MEHNKILRGFFFWKIIQLTPKRISEVNSEAHFEKVRRKDSSEISVIIFFQKEPMKLVVIETLCIEGVIIISGCTPNGFHWIVGYGILINRKNMR